MKKILFSLLMAMMVSGAVNVSAYTVSLVGADTNGKIYYMCSLTADTKTRLETAVVLKNNKKNEKENFSKEVLNELQLRLLNEKTVARFA